MLDEPTVGLDPVLRRDLWALFRDLADRGVTLLVCSHVMDEAAHCDRLLLLREGRLLADDTLDGLLARTGTDDVEAAFLALVDDAARRTGRADEEPGMSTRRTLATARRVLAQLRHDPRTIALLLVVPCVLVGLLAWIFHGTSTFDQIGAPLLGIFPFVVMFLVTSIATLRERTSGTLERLLTMPLGKLDLLLGYALAFGAVAVVQAGLVCTLSLTVFGLDVAGPAWMLRPGGPRRRPAGHGAGPVRQRVRGHRVPGRAVHAGVRAAAVPALRAAGAARGDARRAARDQLGAAAVLRRGRAP